MRKYLLIILFSLFTIKYSAAFGQCSVSKDDSDPNMTLLLTKSEKLFMNEDLENGLKTVYVQSLLVANKIDKNKVKFSVIVTYVGTMYQPTIVPRQIVFKFTNGVSMIYSADEYDTPNLNGTQGQRCYFRITVPDMEKIKSNPISSFTINDTRTSQSLTTNPYAGIFQEQVQCLIKRQSEL